MSKIYPSCKYCQKSDKCKEKESPSGCEGLDFVPIEEPKDYQEYPDKY